MNDLVLNSNPAVVETLEKYPSHVQQQMRFLRKLIIDTANEMEEVNVLEETLKWGEPSYITKHGSTLRMDWKAKNPLHYALYFKCTSRLVETFKTCFSSLNYEGNRAIVFQLDQEVPVHEIRECIKATLRYHKVKHLPHLGMNERHL